MSICIVRGSLLCDACVKYVVPVYHKENRLTCAVEVNDLCTKCIYNKPGEEGVYVRQVDYESERGLVQLVEKQSPWCRAMRRHRQWNSWGFAASLLLGLLFFILLFAWCALTVGNLVSEELLRTVTQ